MSRRLSFGSAHRSRRGLAGWSAVLLAGLLVVIGAAPASAGPGGPSDQVKGTVGLSSFGSGECVYVPSKGPDPLKAIKVDAPDLFWPDRTSATNEQGKVTCVIQLYDASNGKKIKTSKTWSATATESVRAPLKNRSIAITPAAGHLYNVWVKAVWYKPDGKVLGSVRHFTGYYRNSTAIYLSWCEPKV